MADIKLRELERAAKAEASADSRVRFTLAARRCGQDVIWRGGSEFELITSGALVNQYFASPAEKILRMAELNIELNLGLTGQDLLTIWQTIPPWTREELRDLVLVLRQPTPQENMKTGWRAIQSTFPAPQHYRWDSIRTDPDHLRLRPGVMPGRAGLEWVVLNLGANRGVLTSAVEVNTFVEAAAMWACALNPGYVRSMNGETVPFAYMGEYQLQLPGYPAWSASPSLSFPQNVGQVRLFARGGTNSHWAVPARE